MATVLILMCGCDQHGYVFGVQLSTKIPVRLGSQYGAGASIASPTSQKMTLE